MLNNSIFSIDFLRYGSDLKGKKMGCVQRNLGDNFDKGEHNLENALTVAQQLSNSGTRFNIGNRDINKLRFLFELTDYDYVNDFAINENTVFWCKDVTSYEDKIAFIKEQLNLDKGLSESAVKEEYNELDFFKKQAIVGKWSAAKTMEAPDLYEYIKRELTKNPSFLVLKKNSIDDTLVTQVLMELCITPEMLKTYPKLLKTQKSGHNLFPYQYSVLSENLRGLFTKNLLKSYVMKVEKGTFYSHILPHPDSIGKDINGRDIQIENYNPDSIEEFVEYQNNTHKEYINNVIDESSSYMLKDDETTFGAENALSNAESITPLSLYIKAGLPASEANGNPGAVISRNTNFYTKKNYQDLADWLIAKGIERVSYGHQPNDANGPVFTTIYNDYGKKVTIGAFDSVGVRTEYNNIQWGESKSNKEFMIKDVTNQTFISDSQYPELFDHIEKKYGDITYKIVPTVTSITKKDGKLKITLELEVTYVDAKGFSNKVEDKLVPQELKQLSSYVEWRKIYDIEKNVNM